MCTYVSTTVGDMKKNQFERRDEKRRHQRQFLQNLDNFLYLSVFCKW